MRAIVRLGVFLACAALSAAHASDLSTRHSGQPSRSTLDGRVEVYAQALKLDANQQTRLRALLVWQRDEVQQVWNDTTLSAAIRVSATKAIGNATADRIRQMLTDEQRKKYNPPPAPHKFNGELELPK